MSYLDRIKSCHDWQPENYRPFFVEGAGAAPFGWVTDDFARRLADYPEVFSVTGDAVELPALGGDFASRSARLEAVLRKLHGSGEIPKWRGEDYGISRRWGEAPLFKMERGAVPLFGLPAYGVHVSGYVQTADGPQLWIGRRAKDKAVAPGKFDNLVAGGQPYGLSLIENVIKEAAEEASLPAELAATAKPVGALRYLCGRPEGQRNDVLFCFDLELPADFQPLPSDGEVEEFFLWPMERVLERLKHSDDFKFNVALVNLHFALRHGFLNSDEEPEYQTLVEGLEGRFAD